MPTRATSDVRARQDPLRARYREAPAEASIVDHARTCKGVESDPFHGFVAPGSADHGVVWRFGIHPALGGTADAPNPGDLLCAALAACLDATIRMIADRLRVELTSLDVDVGAEVDVRGTLGVARDVPVGFQRLRCRATLRTAEGTPRELAATVLAAAEERCVVLRTLLAGVAVDSSAEVDGVALPRATRAGRTT